MPVAHLGRGCIVGGLRFRVLNTRANIVLAEYIQAIEDAAVRLDRLTKQVSEAMSSWSMGLVVEAYQAVRGAALITAVTFVVEIGDVRRFDSAAQLMAYLGLVPSESSAEIGCGVAASPTLVTPERDAC